jgi:hypothetical protein
MSVSETDMLLSNQEFDRVPYDECCDQLADLCRKLESERDRARDWVFRLRKHRAIARNFGEQMERERDQYRRNLELIAEDCEARLNSESDEPSAELIKLVAKYAREAIK